MVFLNHSRKPNVLFIVVDCLRADFIYQDGLAEIPVLRRLLAEGFSFRKAFTPFPMTTPSFASLLTGEFPYRHGAWTLTGHQLNPECRTLPECLKTSGYSTFAEMAGPLISRTGLHRGFDVCRIRQRHQTIHSGWGERFLEDGVRSLPEPWFLFLHIWSLHEPRVILPACREKRFGATEYGRALASIDVYLGRLLERLSSTTLLVLTGDHGEEISHGPVDKLYRQARTKVYRYMKKFGLTRRHPHYVFRKHYEGHSSTGFSDRLLHVPLLFHAPGWVQPGRADIQIRHFDSMPTILEMAGAPVPEGMAGKSLCGMMQGAAEPPRDVFLGDAGAPAVIKKSRLSGIRSGDKYKYIFSPYYRSFAPELFDLAADPGEKRSVARQQPDVCASLRAQIDALGPGYLERCVINQDEKEKIVKRLKALGYTD